MSRLSIGAVLDEYHGRSLGFVLMRAKGHRRRTDMAMEVRRIVTGHDANGKAVIKTDERLPAVSRLGAAAHCRL